MRLIKILSFTLFFGLGGVFTSGAQEVGLRFGNITDNYVALDGVFALGDFSRVHANLSFGNQGVGIDALWHPIYKPISDTEFLYYLGFGPSLFLGDPFNFGAAGEIGAEYVFEDVPIVIGMDWRPYFILVESTYFDAVGFGLNIRYRLN